MKGNKKMLVILLPLAVVVPMLAASWIIGPQSIYVWAGVGLGMVAVWWMNRKPQPDQQPQDEVQE